VRCGQIDTIMPSTTLTINHFRMNSGICVANSASEAVNSVLAGCVRTFWPNCNVWIDV
jgi:hypothetical protein